MAPVIDEVSTTLPSAAETEASPAGSEAPAACAFTTGDPLLRAYHDEEWGMPVLDSERMWEALVLCTFSAGLSWLTVLRKRDALRIAFHGFMPDVVAKFRFADRERLLHDEGILRSTSKILATIQNARAFEKMQASGDEFASFVWSVASTPGLSRQGLVDALVDELKERGFRFIGPVIIHAWLQSVGVWNDHVEGCPRRAEMCTFGP